MRLIDFDQVTLSSLNRSAVATLEDVGTPKVEAMKRHFLQTVPWAQIDARNSLFHIDQAETLLEGDVDFVLDCIDNVVTKCDLLKFCHERGLPVISAMGAGMKADPSFVRVADISETVVDPLARSTKKRLTKMGIMRGIKCVYSTEPARMSLLPLSEEQHDEVDEFRALPDIQMRVRIVPVLGTMPALMGNAMAASVMLDLAQVPMCPRPTFTGRHQFYRKLQMALSTREVNVFGVPRKDITELPRDEMEFLVETVWAGRSAISATVTSLTLTRWDRSKPFSVTNSLLATVQECKAHDKIESLDKVNKQIAKYVAERHRIAVEWAERKVKPHKRQHAIEESGSTKKHETAKTDEEE